MGDDRGKVEYFQGDDGKWYCTISSANGDVLFRSTDGYDRVGGAENGFDSLLEMLSSGKFEVKGPNPA